MISRHTIPVDFGGKSMTIPFFEIVGEREGLHGFITGGMHGNEINGIATVRALLDWFEQDHGRDRLHGKRSLIPAINPSGRAHGQRRVFEDNETVNRCFGASPATTFSHHLANLLTESVFRHCNFGIDVHDTGGSAALNPHCRVHSSDISECQACSTYMGQLLGTKIIVSRPGKKGMLATFLHRAFDIAVLTVELGGSQRLNKTRPSEVARSSNAGSSKVALPSSWAVTTSMPRRRRPSVIAQRT